ncbi:MAG: heavy-metal-associated domain-containing protein [Casimicrobiaceae bacterium]
MLQFKVSGMSCGGCVASVTRAIKLAHPSASVDVDLPGQIVKVEVLEDPESVARLIEGEGFPVLEKTTL